MVAAGAELLQPPADQFHGDRTVILRDPHGHVWVLDARGGRGPGRGRSAREDPLQLSGQAGEGHLRRGRRCPPRRRQAKALWPVMDLPTIRVFISREPSKEYTASASEKNFAIS
ncbi:hypothetical protein [Saccharopolyspora sp. NPDC002686]|uniref:VOC family protein n=1 Tax=Saccharopolyspora sp. NPDC002686 TaxID=3154541 RepID=UPI00332C8ACC